MTVFLIILAVLLGVMVLLLLSVAEVDFSFDEKVLFAVRINGLKVYSNDANMNMNLFAIYMEMK